MRTTSMQAWRLECLRSSMVTAGELEVSVEGASLNGSSATMQGQGTFVLASDGKRRKLSSLDEGGSGLGDIAT